MKVYIASDHAGFELKTALVLFLTEHGFQCEDLGPFEKKNDDDYPDWVAKVAARVSTAPDTSRGIVIGGSGQGEGMVANRFPNVRAVVFNGQFSPKDGRTVPDEIVLSREHNNANILSLGARFVNAAEAAEASEKWLSTAFSGDDRHQRRIAKIE